MTQFGTFLCKIALFLFLIISVSANQKKVPEEIVTKMSLGEYCNFFKKPFCSLPNLDVVVIVVTTSGIDDTCAGELIKKAKDEYGIKEIFGVFNFGINSYPQESENRFRYLDTKVMCFADILIKQK
jgi:hypothetical protein